MFADDIGRTARGLYEKLADNLAEPFHRILPQDWVVQALREEAHRFRQAVFSPRSDRLDLYRPSP